jgi:hypothetical protein
MNLVGSVIACLFVLSWQSVCLPPSLPATAGGGCTIYALLVTDNQVNRPRQNRRSLNLQEPKPDNDPIGA